MISILDYGVGNVRAFINLYQSLGVKAEAVSDPKKLKHSKKIILPGVGHFDYAMKQLKNSNLDNVLLELVKVHKIPILGICVGMQMLAKNSEEGIENGLDLIDSNVVKLSTKNLLHKPNLPHMGWNNISINQNHPILNNLDSKSEFYFLHSYYMECKNNLNVLATCNYGQNFPAIINNENVYGMQCHPEKSHQSGINFLINFSKI